MKLQVLIFSGLMIAVTATAQHEGHTRPAADTITTGHGQHQGHQMPAAGTAEAETEPPMSHAFSLSLPMTRNGSGTGWLPDASPMYGYMLHSRKWMYMIHGNVFLRYNNQDITNKGTRGDSKVDAPNWVMAMGQRRVGARGLIRFSTMFSLDPLFGGDGYPLLFQTGETWQGQPLVDRQHPHNLFSELSVGYTHQFSEDVDVFGYLAYPGEPALGPVAFMHRPASLNNLDSPLGHHWQDATHIIFGVATLGVRYKIFKLDGSIFTGREPGEARYGFDRATFDSYAFRLSANPHPQWALQASGAYMISPEASHPEENVRRYTASALHSLPFGGENSFLTSSLVWGYNQGEEEHGAGQAHEAHNEHSVTLESNLQRDRFALYGRYEWIQKSARELQVPRYPEGTIFAINALTLGTNYTVYRGFNTNFALGVQASVYKADSRLDPIYGNTPFSGQVYLRVSPHLMQTSMADRQHRGMEH
jgi:hypothetical protein